MGSEDAEGVLTEMVAERVMIGVGAALIAGMLLAAAFSLGVYVGEHGWTWEGVSLAGPAGPPALPGRPGGPAPPGQGFPPGPLGDLQLPPDVVGLVRALEDGSLRVATRDGPRSVAVNERTRVRVGSEEVADVTALQPGTLIAVFGHLGDEGRTLVADVVVILDHRPGAGE
ncbi:MAG: hypothetical protein PVH62_01520 [Anaerolineae bacterium]|jgi:hypothetical protein